MIDRKEFLEYEIRSSLWARYVSWVWLQKIASSYFAWKVRYKYNRYRISIMEQQAIENKSTPCEPS